MTETPEPGINPNGCSVCGKATTAHYCSEECRTEGRRRRRQEGLVACCKCKKWQPLMPMKRTCSDCAPPSQPKYEGQIKKCATCSKRFVVNSNAHRFCSAKCRSKAKAEE